MLIWLEFFFLTATITFFGFKLSVLADEISDLTGLGRNLIGLILLSSITSLPELVAGISAVTIAQNPNLAVGDIMGSSCFNLATVVLLDFFYREGSVYNRSTRTHITMCVLGIFLIAFTGFSMSVKDMGWMTFGGLSTYSLIIPVLYLFSISTIYRLEKSSNETKKKEGTLRPVILKFIGCSLFIVVCGIFLPQTAEKIIHLMGWNAAFVGTFFVALATSLPEIAVTLSALRINAAELAFSNLLGSNIFNFMILAVDDMAYLGGPLLRESDGSHVVTAFSALMMTGLVALALIKPPQKKFLNAISGLSFLILCIYGLNLYVSFNSGN